MTRIAEQIVSEVERWSGVTSAPHRFGGIEFRINHREIGHLHGDRLADLPFPTRIRDELVAAPARCRTTSFPIQAGSASGFAEPRMCLPSSSSSG